jgi:hypothetical protein
MQTYLMSRSTAGLTAVYCRARAVSRPGRAGASESGRGAAYRSSRAVYRGRAAAYRRRRRGRSAGAADEAQQDTDGGV